MNFGMKYRAAILLAAAGLAFPAARAEQWRVVSPNRRVIVAVELSGGEPAFRVYLRKGDKLREALGRSPLGLVRSDGSFGNGLRFVGRLGPRRVETRYEMPHGKRRECRNAANESVFIFKNPDGLVMELAARAYDDGAAFQYRFPGPKGKDARILKELTGFAFPKGARLWMHPADRIATYSPAYETYYEDGAGVDAVSPTGQGWSFPVLFCDEEGAVWGLVTEAALPSDSFGARLASRAENGVFRIRLPDPAEGNGYGEPEPRVTLPWRSAWRVVILGDSPGAMVESTLVTDVAPPCALKDVSWIRPGRVAWSWWSDAASPRDAEKQKAFVDLAAEMGWEYVLVDANWTIMERGNVREVIDYAKRKGVSVLLWYNSGGPHNVVTEKPRGNMFFRPVRRYEMEMLRRWGVKGVKVDFFQSDKPPIIALYRAILEDAKDFHLMVNFHGCTLPRGWERTYPHLMSMEAVRGEECYIFDSKYPDRAPVQNAILPFTRNAVGPMDYTPCGFSDNRHPHKTTFGHELALAVLFESGWIHFCDSVESYRRLPAPAKALLREAPAAWDDTRFLAGYPGRRVVLARRSGKKWWIAGVNGRPRGAVWELDLSRLGGGIGGTLRWVTDGEGPRRLTAGNRRVGADGLWRIGVRPYGGFLAVLEPDRD